jgi:hypothetical protein
MPIGVSFGSYVSSLCRATYEYVKDVEWAEKEAVEEVARMREKLNISTKYVPDAHVERHSMTVQIYVALSLEAAIDMYAVVKFSEGVARRTWKRNPRGGTAAKLKEMLEAGTGVILEPDAEILTLVRRVFDTRNAFVHPKGDEISQEDERNGVRSRKELVFPAHDGDAARAAFADLRRFFELIHKLDPELGPMIHPW